MPFRHGRNRNSCALAEAEQDDGHGPPQPKGLLAGEIATTREPKAWSWHSGSLYHYFRSHPQFSSTSISKVNVSGSGVNSAAGCGGH